MNTKNNEGPQPWIDPALEARVVASVLGETSAFEAAELDRVLAENPELAEVPLQLIHQPGIPRHPHGFQPVGIGNRRDGFLWLRPPHGHAKKARTPTAG